MHLDLSATPAEHSSNSPNLHNIGEWPDDYTVSTAYWRLPYNQRRWRTVAEIFSLPNPEDKAVQIRLSRAVQRYEENGYVRHYVNKQAPSFDNDVFPRLHQLEAEMQRRFGLREVVIVDTSSINLTGASVQSCSYDSRSTEIHRMLGAWGGRVFLSTLRNADVVGVGSGRAAYFTLESLKKLRLSRQTRPKTIFSLMGRMPEHLTVSPEHNVILGLSADDNASSLSSSFGVSDLQRVVTNLGDTMIGEVQLSYAANLRFATVVLLGIGVVTGYHPFILNRHASELQSLTSDLETVVSLIKYAEQQTGLSPIVGQFAGKLFLTTHHDDTRGKLLELNECVSRLNCKIVGASLSQLGSICARGSVIAIAGDPSKVQITRHLIQREPPVISHLIIDDVTATAITTL